MSVTKIKAGTVIPLENPSQGTVQFVNYGSPHVHITKTPAGDDSFLQGGPGMVPNTSNILFDSYWFEYLRIDQAISFSATLPSRIGTYVDGGKKGSSYYSPVSGSQLYYLGAHGRVDVPAFFATGGTNVLSTAVFGHGKSLRTVTVISDSSALYLKESYIAVETTIPSLTISGALYILKSSLTSAGGQYIPSNYGMYVTPTRTILGQGKFDTDYNYLYINPNGFKAYRTAALRGQYLQTGPTLTNSFSVMQDGAAIYNITNRFGNIGPLNDLIPLERVRGTTMGIGVP